nr:MAG TPA: hypothetical protein [Bacteriophage sp.]
MPLRNRTGAHAASHHIAAHERPLKWGWPLIGGRKRIMPYITITRHFVFCNVLCLTKPMYFAIRLIGACGSTFPPPEKFLFSLKIV